MNIIGYKNFDLFLTLSFTHLFSIDGDYCLMSRTCPRTGMNFFVDGRGYAGIASAFRKPDLATQITQNPNTLSKSMELYTDASFMDCSVILSAYDRDVLALFGVIEGSDISARLTDPHGAQTRYPKSYTLCGHVIRIANPTDFNENVAPLTLDLNLVLFQEYRGAQPVQTIDILARTFQYSPYEQDTESP